jgi:hypothetical protein
LISFISTPSSLANLRALGLAAEISEIFFAKKSCFRFSFTIISFFISSFISSFSILGLSLISSLFSKINIMSPSDTLSPTLIFI